MDALEKMIAHQRGRVVQFILHYLDDFLSVCQDIRIPVTAGKVVAPTTVIEFLGIVIDTMQIEVRLPEEKLCISKP